MERQFGHPLPLQTIKQITALDFPLPTATRQGACAIHEVLRVDAQHAHLCHRADKSGIPRTLAQCKAIEWDRGEGILSNVLVGWKGEGRFAIFGFLIKLVVPGTNGRIH